LSGSVVPLSTIELVFYDDASSAASAFKDGTVDAVGDLTPEATDAALGAKGSSLVSYRWANMLGVVLNQRSTHPEFQDADVRIALLAAIDRAALLSTVLENRGSVADLPIPDWSAAYDASAASPTLYSPAAAENGLTGAGWKRSASGWTAPNGTSTYTLDLLTPDAAGNAYAFSTAQSVAASWTAIGLDVTVDAVPVATYLNRLNAGDFVAAAVDFNVGLDPDLGPLLLSSQVGGGGSNVAGVQDRTLDQLILAARKAVDPVGRQNAVSAVEKYISGSVPILPLVFRDYDFVISGRLRNVFGVDIANPSSRYWDVIDWRLASDG
jgi:peptide/nickel transport system substrate-binding protein